MKRRKFLRNSVTGALAATMAPNVLISSCRNTQKLHTIGLIIGMVGEELKKDHVKALEQIAEIGYNAVEFGRFLGPSKKEFMDLLKRLNLRPVAGGSTMSPLLERADEIIEEQLSMNKEYLVCYWPWLSSARELTNDQCKEAAENLNKIGEKCNKSGIRFAFHNHDWEFHATPDGDIPFDILMQNTEPELVTCELDLYWIKKGGGDIISYFHKYPGRYELFHVKDMGNDLEDRRDFACVGSGIMDFQKIFAESEVAGMKYPIVEHDDPENGMECARTSYEYLSQLRF